MIMNAKCICRFHAICWDIKATKTTDTWFKGHPEFLTLNRAGILYLQMKYFTEAHTVYSELAEKLCAGKEDSLDSEDYDRRVQQRINEIIALSITADN